MLKIDSMRLQTPRRWVSFSFLYSHSLRFGPFSVFSTLSSSTNPGAYWFLPLRLHFRSQFLYFTCTLRSSLPPLFCALLTSTTSTHPLFPTVCSFSQSCFRNLHQARRTTPLESSRIVVRTSHTCLESKPNHPRPLKMFGSLNPVPLMRNV